MFNNMLMGAAGESIKATSFPVDNSAMFNNDDSEYLTRTPISGGNQRTWTLSFWFKFGSITGRQMFFSQNNAYIDINENSTTSAVINMYIVGNDSPGWYWETVAMFRDPHAWYHVVVAFDSTHSTTDSRLRLYINGDEITSFTKHATGAQNNQHDIGGTSAMFIGAGNSATPAGFYDGYFAEYVYVNGSQLAPTSFGEKDSNGVWRPVSIENAGLTFGTNGFYLPFTNSAGLGQDYSGTSGTTVVQKNTYNAGSEINEGDTAANPSTGMLFVPIASGTVSKIELNASARGFSGVTVRLETDSGSGQAPSGTLVTNGEVTGITSSGSGLKTATFSTPPEVTAGVKYWIVLRGDTGTWGWQHDVSGVGGALGLYQGSTQGYFSGRGVGHYVYMTGNHFTAVNSPTQTTDTCTNNHCVWSEIFPKRSGNWTMSEGNRKATYSSSTDCGCPGSIGVSGAGTWYFEITASSSYTVAGLVSSAAVSSSDLASTTSSNGFSDLGGVAYGYYANNGYKMGGPSNVHASYGATFANTDVIGVAFDAANGTLTFYKNGSTQGQAFTGISTSETWFPFVHTFTNEPGVLLNNGQTAFAHTPPTGYVGINTANLLLASAPTIEDGSAHHQTSLWEGDITARKITQSGFNSKFQPDWIWGKNRDNSGYSYRYFDSVRGATKVLQTGGSSYTDPEATDSNGVTDFEADGFDIGNGVHLNGDGEDIVAWQWAAGGEPTVDNDAGAGATPTAGSVKIDGSNLGSSLGGTIPVTRLSANRKSGFSIGTYTGSGSNGTIATGLTTKPDMLIIKKRGDDGGNNWVTYHSGLANQGTGYVDLGTNAAEGTLANMFNSVAPGSSDATLFNVGTNTSTNDTGGSDTYVFYCFHSVSGYSKFGTYTGNGGSGDGPLVNLGFSPSWILYRNISASAGWRVFDSARDISNVVEQSLTPNTTNSEKGDQSNVQGDFLSNGWKVRNPSNTGDGGNVNNNVYIYAAFAEHPFAGTTPATAR